MVWNSISEMDTLSAGMVFRGVLRSAVDLSLVPAVSNARVITIFFIWVGALLLIEVSFVAVMVVPPVEMSLLFRVSIDPFMIPV
jgi:hypothetical protein